MNILTYFPPSIHFYRLPLKFGDFDLDGTAGIGGWDFKLEFELVPNEIMGVFAGAEPQLAFFLGFKFEPIIIALFIGLDVDDEGFEFFFQPVLPFRIFGSGVDGEEGDVVSGFFQ